MFVTTLVLQNFRNYENLALALSPTLNIFLGPNAQGKTNLLEAIYYASLTHSHRTRRDGDLIRFGQPAGCIQLAFSRAGVKNRIDIRLPRAGRRKIALNGQAARPRELIGCLTTVLFSPEDLFLIKGAPQGRRRFLDSELSQASPAYYHELLTYNHLLQQRNALLKRIRENHAPESLLDPWDPQLAASAAKIARKRQAAVQKLDALARRVQQSITSAGTGASETLTLAYEFHGADEAPALASFVSARATDDPAAAGRNVGWNVATNNVGKNNVGTNDVGTNNVGWNVATNDVGTNVVTNADASRVTASRTPDVTSALELWYNKRLEARRSLDILRGATSVGPHRDDLALTVDGVDLRAYGSQGQQRTGALALKLSELAFLKSETGEAPVLLLDDVMSELDADRRQALLAYLDREHIQTIITATDAAYFPKEDFGTVFYVKGGKVERG